MGRHKQPYIPSDRDRALCAMFQAGGVTLQTCGDAFHLTRERVRQILKQNGIDERFTWSFKNSGQLASALDLYQMGHSVSEISKELCASASTVTYYLSTEKVLTADVKEKHREARFWRSAAITANPDQCWLWQKLTHPVSGYGMFHYKGEVYAHRQAFRFYYKRKPIRWVLHSCDTPACINPYHLREGTALDNAKDREERGRSWNKTGRIYKRLTDDEVAEIRRLLTVGHVQHAIAQKYGVTTSVINRINTGKTRSQFFSS